ncbi:MAG: hypothetical protein IJN80_02495 [Clostridia bacterium]|nr:hypothetical protein [Clostridia bacterium]
MRKSKFRILCIAVIAVLLVGMYPFAASAEGEKSLSEKQIAYFSAPALFADVGETIDLSDCSVMFEVNNVTPASEITWSSEDIAIIDGKITPAAKGVYTLFAIGAGYGKDIYLVVKDPSEEEYVLYQKDFSNVESFAALQQEGYFIAQKSYGQNVLVTNGKLVLDGDSANKQMRVLLPWWIADFGDYTFEANISFDDAYNNTRWLALGYRTQRGTGYYPYIPYQVFTTRANSHENHSGVEFNRTTTADTWNTAFGAQNTFNIYQNGSHLYKVEAYGTHQTGSIDGVVVHDNEFPSEHTTGGVGFVSGGAEIAVSDLKITLDRKAIERLYKKVITDADPALYAKAGEKIDLSQYSVMYNNASAVCAEHLAWSSSELIITNGMVSAEKAGVYSLTASVKNPPVNVSGNPATLSRTIYLMVNTKMNEVDAPASNVVMPASVITYINSKAELEGLLSYDPAPATAILRLNEKLDAVNKEGEKIASLEDALLALGERVIPAFYVAHTKAVDALCAYAEKNDLSDSFVVAQDPSLIKQAREGYYFFRGVLDLSGRQLESLYEARKRTNEAGARICILPDSLVNKKNVENLQRLFMTVWAEPQDASPVELVGAITGGANGIITSDPAALMDAFTKYFDENTITRSTALIGHRGSPSLGQPNTVAGSMKAYEAGATAIENDVYITADGVVVVMHDATIDATTNGSGKVENMTYAQLQQYHVDVNVNADPEPIPTLEEYFEVFKGMDVQLIVEIKSAKAAICQAIADLIEKYDIANQVNVISFNGAQLLEMKRILPEISVGLLSSAVIANDHAIDISTYKILNIVQRYNSTLNPQFSKGPVDKGVMTAAHHRGVGLHLWTLNNANDQNYYFMNGANSLTTDYTQNFSDMVKSLSTPKDIYRITSNGINFKLTSKTYDRGVAAVSAAEMRIIEGDEIFTYKNGRITANGNGSATVIFTMPCTTSNGQSYHVASEPIVLRYEDVVPGDIGCDGMVTIADAVVLLRYLLGDVDEIALANADMNHDEIISTADAVEILRYAMKQP